jgi:hypothetical protein
MKLTGMTDLINVQDGCANFHISMEITSNNMSFELELLYRIEPVDGNSENNLSCTWIGSGGGLGNLKCILAMKESPFMREESDGSN